MNGYFLAMIIINVLNIGIELAKHGEPRKDKHNVFTQLLGSTIGLTIIYMAIRTGF